jgi:N-acetyltransferase 10
VVVGDRQKDVIVNLYHILLNIDVKLNKSVLWAYKSKLLGFTSHRLKREKKIRSEIKRGIREADASDPFELFVSTQNIRYVYYKESEKILGNTYGICILQDFEAVTPNLLARTIETVQGGGLVILLLKGMTSLKQLYTLSMDVHSRYRTEAHHDVVARFNERFILSLGGCDSCLVVDDELNVLPISGGKSVVALPPPDRSLEVESASQLELERVKESLADTQPIGSLIPLAKTLDQAKSLLTFVDAISEKTLQSTVALTAARGRGKSAALGMAIAAAVAHGYSNIFVTSPSPENLKTLFEFIFKSFDALGYQDHLDYSIIQSTNPDFNKAIVRVNIHRNHRQTIQYIRPEDHHVLGQAELVVIDEAAAIPLPLVKKLLGNYLVFMASTINGYEGTGRSLSLKLIQQLREQAHGSDGKKALDTNGSRDSDKPATHHRKLREITLNEPIRYAAGDSVERWLNTVLCLNATLPRSSGITGCPVPAQCELLMVNRDTLFSFHPVSEKFLHKMMALYVASHYKNSPNDLQLMSDAPAHQLYVLVPPVEATSDRLPEPLCVIQVALEGEISRETVMSSLSRGHRAAGDLIPWLVSQQFQDEEFASLSGARVVRIATNPEYLGMGYGSRALQLLTEFYERKFVSLDEQMVSEPAEMVRVTDEELEHSTLLQDNIKIRDIQNMPPLFSRLSEVRPPKLDYVGVSYGLTPPLHKFWRAAGFSPVYLRQTANDLTGEHTCVMLRALDIDGTIEASWLGAFARDFHKRLLSLLSYQFSSFPSATALSIHASAQTGAALDGLSGQDILAKPDLDLLFSPYDIKRLEKYADQMVDYHLIVDMLPKLAELYFTGRMGTMVGLSRVQEAILLALGLQHKTLEDLEKELNLGSGQLLGIFIKIIRKISSSFRSVVEGEVGKAVPKRAAEIKLHNGQTESGDGGADELQRSKLHPLEQSLDDEFAESAKLQNAEEKERIRNMIDALPLERYEVGDGGADWDDAEQQVRTAAKSKKDNVTISVRSHQSDGSKRKAETDKGLGDGGQKHSKSHKKKKKFKSG